MSSGLGGLLGQERHIVMMWPVCHGMRSVRSRWDLTGYEEGETQIRKDYG
eukprot:CAMPEP_0177618848 /NCGR_PEP_ID=MMETSP0419_2-20121207/25862_1 /TAXON_ID=582737 /ORGANISM="Tetraselmis sp., Strain GSL018" /LENGTH=49 /DNA_ID= /DNA_START= /DNA_END= /DNA_ORIENTATION=